MFRLRFNRIAIAALLLASSLHAVARDVAAPEVPVAPAAAQRVFSPELHGVVEQRHLEHLAELDVLADDARIKAMVAAAEADAESRLAAHAERYGSSDASGPTINETRSLKSNGRVYVSNVAGLIEVSVWDRNEVAINGRLGSSRESLELTGDSNELSVVVRLPKQSHTSHDTVLALKVPNNARIDLETVSADVVVNGARGPVKANTVSGDMRLVLASTEVTLQTVSGDLTLKAPAARSTRINSVSGDLELEGLGGELALETVSGNVELSRGGRFGDIKLKSISGDMRLDVGLDSAAQVSGQTLSGEIVMIVPQALSGTALLKSFSGDAECEGAQTVENHSSRKREYRWGDGRGARVDLSSFSGDIRVERK